MCMEENNLKISLALYIRLEFSENYFDFNRVFGPHSPKKLFLHGIPL